MAEFKPMEIGRAQEFLKSNHWGVLATRRKNDSLQMSPVTVGLDGEGRAIVSSRETAYKVTNLRRDPRAAVCAFTNSFTVNMGTVSGTAEIIHATRAEDAGSPDRQAYGEHKSWPEFHERMVREKRVIIRIIIETVGPKVRG
jgi:PPOX class probable F420-dependent enzyme